ncbi:MAG TPA: DUF1614 domain-containing protein [Candidatus Desulfofervidus auxilii]|uniref:DUF1614 domain-containing protein n=1 Tax=Desulfofervidus auxilii TaxID=1621989 RepID=A0A7C0Y5D8_DESA2|nr:DUF1614 domain-containing protein [Candidatus Desulfofervidus auxilii]
MFFPPFLLLFIFFFFFIWLFLFALLHLGLISYAFTKIGIPAEYMMGLLFICLLGSFINIPIKKMPSPQLIVKEVITYWGIKVKIPYYSSSYTIIAINVGGAIIPILISLYLTAKFGGIFKIILAVTTVTFITHRFAKPIPGLGITVPVFIPPITAALIALILDTEHAPALAYIAGTLGTLIGADLMNLNRIKELKAPVVSIGGAGTFDGIFFTGILAVLLA